MAQGKDHKIHAQVERVKAALEAEYDSARLWRSRNVMFALSRTLRLAWWNQAWEDFARSNQGEKLLQGYAVGSRMLPCMPPFLRPYFREQFRRAQSSRTRVDYDYHCSSPEFYRLNRMSIYPLPQAAGFLVFCAVRVEVPHVSGPYSPMPPCRDMYYTEAGYRAMCANCCRVRRVDYPRRWDFVPAYFSQDREHVTWALCPVCLNFFFPEVTAWRPV